MPRICPEFEVVQVASTVTALTMLSYAKTKMGTPFLGDARRLLKTHTCLSICAEDGSARVWAISACSSIGSFIIAQLADNVVTSACGVTGKGDAATLVSDAQATFADAPASVKLFATWFAVSLNSVASRFCVSLPGQPDVSTCMQAMTRRVAEYTKSQSRVRKAGFTWASHNAKNVDASDKTDAVVCASKKEKTVDAPRKHSRHEKRGRHTATSTNTADVVATHVHNKKTVKTSSSARHRGRSKKRHRAVETETQEELADRQMLYACQATCIATLKAALMGEKLAVRFT
jgi:hypothetical protein